MFDPFPKGTVEGDPFRGWITFTSHNHPMPAATTPTPEPKGQPSLFTRLAAVEGELQSMKALLAGLKVDHDALREDRDEWRWRAERMLAEREQGALARWGRRAEEALAPLAVRLAALLRKHWLKTADATLFRLVRLKLNEPKDDGAVALARPPHGPHPIHDGRLDLDEALAPIALHWPPR